MAHIIVTATTTAADLASVCFTAAAVKDYYKDLTAAGLEPAAARDLIRAAAAIVKDRAAGVRTDAAAARAWYRDGGRVLNSVFAGFSKSADFKKFVGTFSGGAGRFVELYFPVQYGPDRRPVKVVTETICGVRFRRYRFINTARPGSFTAILDGCLNNIKSARIAGDETRVKIIPARSAE